MVQMHEIEILPIFYYGKIPKTKKMSLKYLIYSWGQPYWMTLAIIWLNVK